MSSSSAAAAPPAWLADAAAVVPALRARLGADAAFVIAPGPVPDVPDLLGCGVRDGAADVAGELAAALGEDLLARTAVVFLGCRDAGVAVEALEGEIDAVADRAACAVVVEPRAPTAPEGWREIEGAFDEGWVGVRARSRPAAGGRPLRVAIWDWYGKSEGLARALEAAGHRMVPEHPALADVALINNDFPGLGRLDYLDQCIEAGGRAFLYPDGGSSRLMCAWDGLYEPYARLSGVLMPAPGHAEVARRYGYPHPVHVVGWWYCDLRPRRPGPVRRVLFAPEHPPYHGNDASPARNGRVLDELVAAGHEVTVRHIGDIAENGLTEHPGVSFVLGDQSGFAEMVAQIDHFDAVVTEGSTFACLAVARGVTTVTWATSTQIHHETLSEARHMDDYRDYVMYPFDLDTGAGVGDLLDAAARDVERVGEWRERFIGRPLDVEAAARALSGA